MSFLSAVNRFYKKEGIKKVLMILAVVWVCFLFAGQVSARSEVVINEVAWMGTASSSSEEWLEFFNTGSSPVDISDWSVYGADTGECLNMADADGTSTTEIASDGYLVYGNSQEVAEIDIWDATIGLNNTDPGVLELYSAPDCPSSSSPVDRVENDSEWSAGDNQTAQTMARNQEGKWRNSLNPGGSPGKSNSVAATSSEDGAASNDQSISSDVDSADSGGVSAGSSSDTSSETKKEQGSLVINEIFPNPERSDRKREFIEIYNPDLNKVDLKGWRIRNKKGKVFQFGRYEFLHDLPSVLGAGDFLILARPDSNLVLNNNQDSLELISPGGKIKQRIDYKQAPAGFSYASPEHLDPENISTSTEMFLRHSLDASDWAWSRDLTPGRANQIDRINLPPRVDFSYSREIMAGRPVLWDSSDTVDPNGDDLSFVWDFGDGVEVKTPLPHHVFLQPGKYKVVLRVSDGRATSTRSRTVRVSPGPDSKKDRFQPEESTDTDPSVENRPKPQKVSSSSPAQTSKKRSEKRSASAPFFNLENIRLLPEGDPVLTEGTVAVRPGVLGSQYFYVVDSAGIQVYNYYKDFPKLRRGDRIQVKGEISVSRGEKRVNTSQAEDIRVLADRPAPRPRSVSCRNIKEKVGSLVRTTGQVTDMNSRKFYIDDGQGEALVYLQEEFASAVDDLSEGEKTEVVGLVDQYNSQIRILPRDSRDLEFLSSSSPAESGRVLGTSSRSRGDTSGKLVLGSQTSNKKGFAHWPEIFLGGIIILLLALIGAYKFKT